MNIGRWWRPALGGAVAVSVIGLGAAAAVFEFGLFDVSASSAHLPEIRWVVHHTMLHSVARRAGSYAPASMRAAQLAEGFCAYHAHCETCHGGPATPRGEWANGLNPPPPYLLDARARWTPGQLHWIISNGVKMTAMPAWKASMSDHQVWSLVGYLEKMSDLSPATYRTWAASPSCPSAADVTAALQAPARVPQSLPTSTQLGPVQPGS